MSPARYQGDRQGLGVFEVWQIDRTRRQSQAGATLRVQQAQIVPTALVGGDWQTVNDTKSRQR